MIRSALPILLGAACSLALHAQDAAAFQAHKIPLVLDTSASFLLCKAKVDGTDVHLLVDSGAQLEFAMTKNWATGQGKELKDSGKGAGIGGNAALFTTKFDSVEVAGAIKLRDLTAHVIELELGIPFAKQEDGTTPKVDGILGSRFLMQARAIVNYADQRLDIPAGDSTGDTFLKLSKAAGKRVIPLAKNSTGGPYVPIKFGDKECYFLVDNAAGSNIILPGLAEEIGLELRDQGIKVGGAGGDAGKVKVGLASNVEIGDQVKLPQLDFVVMPTPGGDDLPDGLRYGGVLGNSFLRQLKVQIDFGSYHLILPPLAKDNGNADNKQAPPAATPEEALEAVLKQHYKEVRLTKSKAGYYFVETKINGKDRWMCLDSGADGILLDRRIAEEDEIELAEGGPAIGADGKSLPSFRGTVKTFRVGEDSFNAASMTFLDLSRFAPLELPDGTSPPTAGQLGIAYLKALPIAVDLPTSRILIAKSNIQGGLAGVRKQLGQLTAPMIEDDKGRHYLVTETMGKKALFLVDLGTLSGMLFEKSAEDLKIEVRDLGGTLTTLGTEDIPRKGASLEQLKIGDHKVRGKLDLVVLPGSETEEVQGMPVIGIAGCLLFEVFRSTVDFHTDQITLSPDLFE